MDEQVINDLYSRAKSQGYQNGLVNFIQLLHSDQQVFDDMFQYVKSQGYQNDENGFATLVGKQNQQQPVELKKKEDGGFFPNPIEQTQQAVQDLGQMEEAQAQQQGTTLAPQGTFLRQMQRSSLASESAPVPLESPSELEDRKYRAPIEAPTPTEELYKMLLPKDIEEAGAEAIRMNEQIPEFLKPSIDVITPQFINRYSDTVKQELEYQFGPSGFKFEETGPVTIDVIAPNGKRKKIEVGGYTAEQNADDLKVFIKENAAELKGLSNLEKQYIGENKKYTTKKNYDNDIRELTQQAKDFDQERNDILAEKYSIETEAEKLKLIPSNKRNTPEFAELMQNYVSKVDAFEKKTADYEIKVKEFEEQGKQFDKAAAKYAEMKAAQGGWMKAGFIPNMLNMGYEQIQKGVFDVGVDYIYNVVSEIGATKDLIGKYAYEEELGKKAKELGYTEYNLGYDVTKGLQTDEFDKLSEDKKEKVRNAIVDIDRAIIDSYKKISKRVGKEDIGSMFKNLRLTDVSDEWFQEKEKSILGGGIIGLGKSVPAMVGFSWMRKIFMYAQATNAIQEEMDKNREFDNISEDEKQLIKIPYGIASAALEEFGLRNLIKNQSVVGNLVKRMIGVAPIGASASQMRNIALFEIKRLGLKSGVPLAGAFLAEAETGAAQQALEFEIKNIYNAVKEKEMFKDVPMSIAEQAYNLRYDQQYVNDLVKSGIQEGIGGFIMKVPSAVTNAVTRNTFAEMYDAKFAAFIDTHLDPDARKLYELQLKGKVSSGKITQKESDEALNKYDRAAGMLRSIPENIVDLSDKKRAMDLIVERQKLEESKKGKDPALVNPIQKKIDSINEQLDKISQDAVQEQTAGEVPVQSEAGVGKAMVQGEPQAGPQVTTQKGVLIPEEGVTEEKPKEKIIELDLSNKSIDDLEKRQYEIEDSRNEEDKKEFKQIDKELEKREWQSVLNSPIEDIEGVVDSLIEKEKKKPNGFGSYIESKDARETKQVAQKYSRQVSKDEAKKDFKDSFFGNPSSQYSDGLKMRESVRAFVEQGGTFKELLQSVQKEFESDGFSEQDAANVIKNKLNEVSRKNISEQPSSQSTIQKSITAKEEVAVTETTPTTEAKVEFTEQDRARKAELEEAMRTADKRRKNITVGDTSIPKADVKAELDALNQKEKASQQPAPTTEAAPEQQQRTAEQEADFLETLLGAPRQTGDGGKKSTDEDKNFIRQAVSNAVKAISKIFPNVKIVVHETNDDFVKATGDNEMPSGLYVPNGKGGGTIHINLSHANRRTVGHEVFHGILLSGVKNDAEAQRLAKAMLNSVMKSLKESGKNQELLKELEKFASRYDENIQNEEKLAELFGMLADSYPRLTPPAKNVITRFLERLAKLFGLKPMTDKQVIDFMNTISKKVATGEEITEKDISKLPKSKKIAEINKRFQANFSDPVSKLSFVYDKNGEDFNNLEKQGFITKDKSLSDFDGKYIFLHQPDAAFSGLIYKNGQLLVEGKGGVYYPIKFHKDGYFWASTSKTAKKMADDLNKVMEQNGGTIYMALTSAPNDKLLSSTTMSNAILDFFSSKAFDTNFQLNPNQLKNALILAANNIKEEKKKNKKGEITTKTVGLNLGLNENISIDEIQSLIKEKLNPDNSNFADRKNFAVELIRIMAENIKNDPKSTEQFAKLFSEGIQNKYFKGVSKTGKLTISAANMTQALSEMFTEPILKDGVDREKGGQVYAIIELSGKVKPILSEKHESYPMAVQSDSKNKVKLHILTDRQYWYDVFEDFETNEIVAEDRRNKIYPTSGVSTMGLKLNTSKAKGLSPRQQKTKKEVKQLEDMASRQQKGKNNLQDIVKQARANNISDEGIRVFLKRNGLSDAEVDNLLGTEPTTRTTKLDEGKLPGYDEMMDKVDAMIARQIKRGIPQDKIAKNLDALLRKFDAYTNATDAQKKALEQEARNRIGADQKKAPSLGRILGAFKDITNLSREEKTIIVNNIMKLAKDAANDLANEIREMKVKGKIKISQFNAIQKRLSKVNFMNETSISTFVEYMTKVFNDVNYAEKIDNANKQLKTAKANVRTKIGVAEVLTPLLKKLFNMDPTLIPMEVFEEYLSVVDMMGKRQTELSLVESQKLTAQVNKILDAVQTELSILDDLIEMFNEYENKQFNEDGSINFSKTLNEMVKDKKITPEDSDLLKKYKSNVIESAEKTKMTPEQKAEEKKELIESIREMEVDGNNLPMREERQDAMALKELVKTDALESLSNSELKNLYKALSNINNGFLSAYSKKMIRTLDSYNDSKTLDTAIENAGRLPLSRLLAKLKSFLPYQKTAESISVKKSPMFFIDQVFGNFKDNPIFRTVFERVAKGFDNYKTDIKVVQEKLDKAFNKVASHYWKNPNKVKMSTFKMMTYALQLEYETNKDSGEFYSAADYILETIDHAMSNDSTLSPYDVAILNKILKEFGKVVGKDENGNDIIDIDTKKLYDSFVDVEKDAIKTIQEVNVSLRDKALYTSAVIRGDKVKVFDNYVHHSVLPTGFVNKSKTGTITAQTQNQNMDPSTRAKSLTERTSGVKPLNFNIFSVTQKGANQILMDFHLTEPVRTTRKTLSETRKKIDNRKKAKKINDITYKKQSDVFNAIDTAFELAFDNVLMNTYQDDSFATSVINFMTKQAYRSILASSGRWVSELLSNLSFVALVDPKAYYNGATKYRGVVMSNLGPQVMRSVNSTVQDRTYAGALLSGKMIDSNIMDQAVGLDGSPAKNAVANVIQTIHNNSTKKYGNFVAATADTLISTPDKMMIRPFWFGVFANNFKDATGQEVDFNKIAENDEQYMNEFKEAIEYSRKTADQMVVFAGTTNNPFMSRQAGQNVKGMNEFAKIFNNFNNFMNNFIIYEFITARTGIYAAMGNGMISRKQGAAMLGGVVLRTTLYSYLISELGGSLLTLFFKAPEEDEEEKKEKSVLGKVGKAVAGSMTSLILGRDFGNMTRSMINYGVESVNEKYIQQFFDNEYTLDDAITYSVIPRTNRPEFVDLMINMSGPMQPYLRTSKKTFDRIMQDPPKKPDAIKRREQDIYFNIPFEWAGNLGIVPLYKDVKKTITPYLKNEVNKITTEMESQRRKTIYEGFDTEKEFMLAEPKLYREKAKRGGALYEYKKKVSENKKKKQLETIQKLREMRKLQGPR